MRKSISKKTRFDVFKRDGFKCVYCGSNPNENKLEIDHIIPVSKGGGNEIGNLMTSCFTCNRGKSANLLTSIPNQLNVKEVQKERLLQYKEYIKYLRENEKMMQESIDIVCEVYERYNDGYTPNEYFRSNIKLFIKKIGVEKTIYALEVALNRVNDKHLLKYFCGVCWTIYKKNNEKSQW